MRCDVVGVDESRTEILKSRLKWVEMGVPYELVTREIPMLSPASFKRKRGFIG
jgi:hypothetical protein